jgi:hypothetical protein
MQNTNASFDAAKKALVEERYEDLENLFDTAKAVVSFAEGNVVVQEGQVFYKDTPVANHVVDRIFAFMKEGLPHKPLLRFLDKLMANPSRRATNELYTFLEHKNMPLTPDGNFLAYKSVKPDWTDHHTGSFVNTVGATLEMVRNGVCDDANVGCSSGFHAGSLEYAKNFFDASVSRLLVVEINPADVVSVPTDCSCQKLRTTKYKVVAEFERPLDEPLNDSYSDYDEGEDDEGEDDEEGVGLEGVFSDGYKVGYNAAQLHMGVAVPHLPAQVSEPSVSKPIVSEATRQKLRDNALRQKRVNGKFI